MKDSEVDWKSNVLEDAKVALGRLPKYSKLVNRSSTTIHLGIFTEPYLDYILEGKKTVEARFSAVKCAPYKRANTGDILLLKKTGGPIVGVCKIGRVWTYNLEPVSWNEIKSSFTDMLCAHDPEFWDSRNKAAYATLMKVAEPVEIPPIECKKRDRRGWVILSPRGIAQERFSF
ncbi:MAG: ASCH domain-containing protein [Haliea sp.]|nr:ASCH domain-containing protein [Haliea sp.]